MTQVKTNAMRILDKENISYEVYTYEHGKEAVNGLKVAHMLHQNPNQVFKTLVTLANSKEYLVFVVPVAHELNLKKCAKVAGVKNVEMIHVKDLRSITGYIRGGCSPIGMKKNYRTFFHESALDFKYIICSAGKIGYQIQIHPKDLASILTIIFADII